MTKKTYEWSREFQERLLAAASSQEFFRIFLAGDGGRPPRLRYAEVCRRAGFAARSYPRDIALGHKRLTYSTGQRLARALDLPETWLDFFLALLSHDLANEESQLRSAAQDVETNRRQLLFALSQDSVTRESQLQSVADGSFQLIHAALGDGAASVSEIHKRTRLPINQLELRLRELVRRDLIIKSSDGKYSPRQRFVSIAVGRSNDVLKQRLVECSKEISQRIRDDAYILPTTLFANATFSVPESRLIEVRTKMRDVLENFMLANEHAKGERLVNVFVALWPV